MTKKEIENLIEDNYELVWENIKEERDGKEVVVARPVKIINVHGKYAKELRDFVREQELGYRIFTRREILK